MSIASWVLEVLIIWNQNGSWKYCKRISSRSSLQSLGPKSLDLAQQPRLHLLEILYGLWTVYISVLYVPNRLTAAYSVVSWAIPVTFTVPWVKVRFIGTKNPVVAGTKLLFRTPRTNQTRVNLTQWQVLHLGHLGSKVSAFCRISTGLCFTWKQSLTRATNIKAIIKKGQAYRQDTIWKLWDILSWK